MYKVGFECCLLLVDQRSMQIAELVLSLNLKVSVQFYLCLLNLIHA